MRKFIKGLLLALVVFMLVGSPVLAYIYRASLTVTESSGNTYSMLGANVSAKISWLESNGFIGTNGTDTLVETLGGTAKPHMLVDDRIMFATVLNPNSQTNLYFTTGETPVLSDFYIIPGYSNNSSVGYVKTPDAAAIEMGDNFTWTANNIYLNTSNGTDKNIIRKDDAFYLFTSNTTSENVTATIPEYNGTETLLVNGNGSLQEFNVLFGAATHWQAVLTIDDATSYIGNTALARKEDLFTVTDTALNTGAVIDSVTVTMRIINASTGRTALKTHGTTYYSGNKNPGGAWTTYTQVYATNPNTGLAWTFDEINDMEIGVNMESVGAQVNCTYVAATIGYHYNAVSTTLTGISSGEYDVTVSANTTHLTLDIGGTSNSTALSGASVPDNANDIYLFENNSVAYCGDIELEIDGVQQLYYNPNDIIVSVGDTGTLPDRSGTNDGTIYFGGIPSGVTTVLGSLSSVTVASDVVIVDTPRDILAPVEVSDWYGDGTVSKAETLVNPVRVAVTVVSDNTTLSEIQVWRFYGLVIWLFCTVAAAFSLRGHQGITMMLSGAILGGLVAFDYNIFPMWLLVVTIGCFIGGIVAERSPSV